MRIAFFHNVPKGGALRVVEEQFKHFSKNNYAKLFSTNFNLEGNRLKKDYDNFFSLDNIHKKLAKEIDDQNFDIVVIHPSRFTQAPFLLQHLKTPSIYYCEEWLRIVYEKELAFKNKSNLFKYYYENITRKYRKYIDYKNAVSANLIIGNSKFTANNLNKAYRKNIKCIYPAVDIKIFKKRKIAKQKQLLFVGGKDKMNGYFFAKQIAIKSNLKLKVIYGNKLTDIELAKEYSRSVATLCVSYNEPFGLVAIESIASGTLVLAINEGGYKETVINEKNGFLLKRDVDEFVEKIELIVKNKIEINFSLNKKFTWEQHNKELEKMILSLIK